MYMQLTHTPIIALVLSLFITQSIDAQTSTTNQRLREAREQFERAYLQQQLVLCEGKVGQLAKRVGMERTHLYRKLRSLGVDFKSVGAEE